VWVKGKRRNGKERDMFAVVIEKKEGLSVGEGQERE